MEILYNIGMFSALWMGISSIIAGILTTGNYWPKARSFIKTFNPLDATGFFVLGIVFVIFGNTLGNLYWQIFWLLDFYEFRYSGEFQDLGLLVNTLFRNGGLLLASYFFYRAFLIAVPKRKGSQANRFIISILISSFFISVLILSFSVL